jgi:hypothetical protein
MKKPAADVSARVIFSMMPFCQCFARRVKSGRRRAPRSRDIGELFASDSVQEEAAWQQLKNCECFQRLRYCAWGCFSAFG